MDLILNIMDFTLHSFFGLATPSAAAGAAPMFAMTSTPPEPEPEPEPPVCAPCRPNSPPPYTRALPTGLVYDERMLGHRDPADADAPGEQY